MKKQKQTLERLLKSPTTLFSHQKIYDRPSRYFANINLPNGKKIKFENKNLEAFLLDVKQATKWLDFNLLDY